MTEYKPEEIISAAYKIAKAIIENEIEDMYKDTYNILEKVLQAKQDFQEARELLEDLEKKMEARN